MAKRNPIRILAWRVHCTTLSLPRTPAPWCPVPVAPGSLLPCKIRVSGVLELARPAQARRVKQVMLIHDTPGCAAAMGKSRPIPSAPKATPQCLPRCACQDMR